MIQTGLKASINIKFDIGKAEVIERYLPTPSHVDAIRGFAKGFLSPTNPHAHILIGPYGTGKSLLGTIVSGLVSKSFDERFLYEWIDKFDQIDEEIYYDLLKVAEQKQTYLPVILNGKKGRFRTVIISAIMNALREQGIELVLPGEVKNILSTIDTWRTTFPDTYRRFIEILEVQGKVFDTWKLELQNYNQQEIDWFKEVYPSLTSGSSLATEIQDDFIEQIQYIVQELDQKKVGLFIVYDEFGRFLQTLDVTSIHETMQDIQDLAELANHCANQLHVLLITHRNMRQYAAYYEEALQQEFQRIEKRFKISHVESDQATFIRLAQHIISTTYPNRNHLLVNHSLVIGELRKYPLFPHLTQTEIENLVVYGLYPLHPVSLFLLPYLSNLLAQNERTLFTFLEDDEPAGMKQHVKHSDTWYFADQLFDYFYQSNDPVFDTFSVFQLYEQLAGKISEEAVRHGDRIVKMITLWELVKMQGKIPLTTEFLSFALGISVPELEDSLAALADKKLIRYNRILGYWELFEGSSVNVHEMIAEREERLSLPKAKKYEAIEKHLAKRFYLASDYNDEKSMIRFGKVVPIFSSDFLDEAFPLNEKLEARFSDANIIYLLLEKEQHRPEVIKKIEASDSLTTFFCVPSLTTEFIEPSIRRKYIIDELLQDPDILRLDSKVKQELLLYKEDEKHIIEQFLKGYTSFTKDYIWYINGKSKLVTSQVALENLLSQAMYEIYPNTIEVRNDSFNRRKLNAVQRRAAISVLNHLLSSYEEENLGIEGFGPDYLIYASTLKNNGINPAQLDNMQDENIHRLRTQLLGLLSEHPEGKLGNIVSLLRNPPYGLREPVIPIFLVALLRDRWEQMLFYANDMFISNITGETIYEMVQEAEQYSYRFYQMKEHYQKVFDDIYQVFFSNEQKVTKQPFVVSEKLLKWLRTLPRFTQITDMLSSEAKWFKGIVRQGEIDPQKSIEQLYERCVSDSMFSFAAIKQELEAFMSEHEEKLQQIIASVTGCQTFDELKSWAAAQSIIVQRENRIAASVLQATEDTWISSIAFALVGVPRGEWSDTTHEMFSSQLQAEWKKTKETVVNENMIRVVIGDEEVSLIQPVELSRKSEVIFQNAHRLIQNAGRTVPKEEIKFLIWRLLQDFS
ncbi:hypothetical protein P4S93_09005 [Aneurinibacillus thermoaerophilus]|uniref:hypothetical protein n=1 Tax=Aneurinibacillus thermoaerophilus TaxID=143495 RepID=UPI002E1F7BE4|nr:hypothetical protein [Aneurinibacillus thermoaerophilus]MED0760915.1 hypothetical protein [Aneurinibacillus thermoaerophilus]